ncbi:cop-coated vesicle membrane protein p24 precursor, putative [Plasmodium ovale curtisi]|uniref:Cop-coated vesicle membrane protein p24, putative n=1 Tax=Plasmodium ovale curtisi TaxID=864141 RepID=A0A1A8W8N3_PLAOA|nr:cop-coated vesicle membrane protein p24 precursor, putative [Plasmodium ovale curtisi]
MYKHTIHRKIAFCAAYYNTNESSEAPLERDCFHFKVDKNNVIVGSYDIINKNASCVISVINRYDKKRESIFKSEKTQDQFEIKNKKNVELTLMFTLRVKESHSTTDSEFSTIDDVQKISNKASALYDQFLDLFDEQERMMETADLYKQFNEKMNSKLVLWSEIEIILLILLTLVHIYYIKSFFEIKTIV